MWLAFLFVTSIQLAVCRFALQNVLPAFVVGAIVPWYFTCCLPAYPQLLQCIHRDCSRVWYQRRHDFSTQPLPHLPEQLFHNQFASGTQGMTHPWMLRTTRRRVMRTRVIPRDARLERDPWA